MSTQSADPKMTEDFKYEINRRRLFNLFYIHFFACLAFFVKMPSWQYLLFSFFYNLIAKFSITAGTHRLFSHRSYKAKTPLKLLFALIQPMAFENSIFTWALRHRVHHKCTDTNADPHNSKRGRLFSHCTWLIYELHPEFHKQSQKVDVSDLENDKIIMFQHKYYPILAIFTAIVLPIYVGCKFFNETFVTAHHYNALRIVISVHTTFIVNSLAHWVGTRPYDKSETAVDNLFVSFFASGEGFHNYHHTFPWDYKTSETKSYWFNTTTAFIDFFAMIGWATNLKEASEESIRSRVLKTGDGTHKYSKEVQS